MQEEFGQYWKDAEVSWGGRYADLDVEIKGQMPSRIKSALGHTVCMLSKANRFMGLFQIVGEEPDLFFKGQLFETERTYHLFRPVPVQDARWESLWQRVREIIDSRYHFPPVYKVESRTI